MNMYTCTSMEGTLLFSHFVSSTCKPQVDRIRKNILKAMKVSCFPISTHRRFLTKQQIENFPKYQSFSD